ncbi:MAG: isoprenylcysteine carboxylmethyltransferase family protein, partial [Planctomycetota bacterium]|nr:isoprenylcysteine carboxylmethyltransferase family protein [Planctomycetota bacterium]
LDHFELFGLKQGIMHFSSKPMPVQKFRQPLFYKLVRHPIMLGFIIAFWSAPVMSQGHLLFAAVTTAYMLVAIRIEEHDLSSSLGDDYRSYQKRTSMILPFPKRKA